MSGEAARASFTLNTVLRIRNTDHESCPVLEMIQKIIIPGSVMIHIFYQSITRKRLLYMIHVHL